MKPGFKILLVLGMLFALSLACSFPAQEQDGLATLVEATTSSRLTHNAPQPTATPLPTAADTPIPLATDTPDPSTVYAPDPLPAQYTGLIFDAGTCYDFDAPQLVAVDDAARDICMIQFGLLEPQNGGLMSGYAPMEPPSKGYCTNPNLLADPIAVQTNLFLCFQTNQSIYGFFVALEYQMDQDRVIFDMYLFP